MTYLFIKTRKDILKRLNIIYSNLPYHVCKITMIVTKYLYEIHASKIFYEAFINDLNISL